MPQLRNYMEYCVDDLLVPVMKRSGACTCTHCVYDVKAIVLNNLPPKYVVTEKGELFTKLSSLQQQFEVDITAAIIRAADIVAKNPRHKNLSNVSS